MTAPPCLPDNLIRLHAEEEQLRVRTHQLVQSSKDLADHLDMMERVMDVLDMLRQHHRATDEGLTIGQLGMRCFNTFASAWKLCASGYYQASIALQRDLIETSELVDYLHGAPDKVSVWAHAEPKQLINEFGPAAIRNALDLRAGQGKSRREEIYKKFCNLAVHPTLAGFAMLRPNGSTDAVIGPFSDITALRAVLEEIGMLSVRVGFAFVLYLNTSIPECNQIAHRFLSGAMDYSGKYFWKVYPASEREEVDRLFGAESSTEWTAE